MAEEEVDCYPIELCVIVVFSDDLKALANESNIRIIETENNTTVHIDRIRQEKKDEKSYSICSIKMKMKKELFNKNNKFEYVYCIKVKGSTNDVRFYREKLLFCPNRSINLNEIVKGDETCVYDGIVVFSSSHNSQAVETNQIVKKTLLECCDLYIDLALRYLTSKYERDYLDSIAYYFKTFLQRFIILFDIWQHENIYRKFIEKILNLVKKNPACVGLSLSTLFVIIQYEIERETALECDEILKLMQINDLYDFDRWFNRINKKNSIGLLIISRFINFNNLNNNDNSLKLLQFGIDLAFTQTNRNDFTIIPINNPDFMKTCKILNEKMSFRINLRDGLNEIKRPSKLLIAIFIKEIMNDKKCVEKYVKTCEIDVILFLIYVLFNNSIESIDNEKLLLNAYSLLERKFNKIDLDEISAQYIQYLFDHCLAILKAVKNKQKLNNDELTMLFLVFKICQFLFVEQPDPPTLNSFMQHFNVTVKCIIKEITERRTFVSFNQIDACFSTQRRNVTFVEPFQLFLRQDQVDVFMSIVKADQEFARRFINVLHTTAQFDVPCLQIVKNNPRIVEAYITLKCQMPNLFSQSSIHLLEAHIRTIVESILNGSINIDRFQEIVVEKELIVQYYGPTYNLIRNKEIEKEKIMNIKKYIECRVFQIEVLKILNGFIEFLQNLPSNVIKKINLKTIEKDTELFQEMNSKSISSFYNDISVFELKEILCDEEQVSIECLNSKLKLSYFFETNDFKYIKILSKFNDNKALNILIQWNIESYKELTVHQFISLILGKLIVHLQSLATNLVNKGVFLVSEFVSLYHESLSVEDWVNLFRKLLANVEDSHIELLTRGLQKIKVFIERKKLVDVFDRLKEKLMIKCATFPDLYLNADGLTLENISQNHKLLGTIMKFDVGKLCAGIERFLQNHTFFIWFRTERAKDVAALMALTNYAGFEDEDIVESLKIDSLRDVGLGFAPLVYDMNFCFLANVFEEAILRFNTNLINNPYLLEELDIIVNEKEWIKSIGTKRSNDNIMKKVKNITEFGLYRVMLPLYKDVQSLTIDDSFNVEVIIEGDKPEDTVRSYFNCKQLEELKDKSILITREKNEELIQNFETIFELVTGICKILIELVNSGNVNFLYFNMQIKTSSSICSINIKYLPDHMPLVKEFKDVHSAIQYLNNLIIMLEECMKDWDKFINKKREMYKVLNYYTDQQLVTIRRLFSNYTKNYLNKIEKNSLLDLLNIINSEISYEMLETIMICDDGLNVNEIRNDCENEDHLTFMKTNYLNNIDRKDESYVNMKQLCKILIDLDRSEDDDINRKIPYYVRHKINLIDCPDHQMLSIILSIYSESPEQPLPTDNEMLFCSEETKIRELELFLKRIIQYASSNNSLKRLYSVAYAHWLPLENVVELVLKYEKALNDTNSVCVCFFYCSEKSRFHMHKLEKFKLSLDNVTFETEKISSYLEQKFIKNTSNGNFGHRKKFLVTSKSSGTGKSLLIRRIYESFNRQYDYNYVYHYIPIKTKKVIIQNVFDKLAAQKKMCMLSDGFKSFYHIDIAFEVFENVDAFLFQLLVMNVLKNSQGNVLRASESDIFMIEIMSPITENGEYLHKMCHIFPNVCCLKPFSLLEKTFEANEFDLNRNKFDDDILTSEAVQRCCQYLRTDNFHNFFFKEREKLDSVTCLKILKDSYKKYRNKKTDSFNPSWSEINYLISMLNQQLVDIENNVFCQQIEAPYNEFRDFVIKFTIKMCFDFGLPSLNITDESTVIFNRKNGLSIDIEKYDIKTKWDKSDHPYLFMNEDRAGFTFFGFYLDSTGQLKNPETNQIIGNYAKIRIQENVSNLIAKFDKTLLSENVNKLNRNSMLEKIMKIMHNNITNEDLKEISKIDSSYELTQDNLLKLMAIYMRIKCNIPVVIMGESGCGKTRLIEYMSRLQIPPKGDQIQTLYVLRIHGGITVNDLNYHVKEAEKLARQNSRIYPNIFTIMLFDEANSTEAIGTIKEIMIDHSIDGRKIDLDNGLRFIATVNPYKRHKPEVLRRQEESSLGYFVESDKISEKLGSIPMRELVYRVQPLPETMAKLVFDFGSLSDKDEKIYIEKMIVNNIQLKPIEKFIFVSTVVASQVYMRDTQDVYSNLRDVKRVIDVYQWFRHKLQHIFNKFPEKVKKDLNNVSEEYNSLLLALAVCYHASIQKGDDRLMYWKQIILYFNHNIKTCIKEVDISHIERLITHSSNAFVSQLKIPDGIALNQALQENVFIMIVCIELKIPLYLIGKPGSSKSLSKALIEQYMNDRNMSIQNSELFSNLKTVFMTQYQCSPLSTSESIINTFKYAAKEQLRIYIKNKSLKKFVSVVVLDEIGLAEASVSMPLKSLHELLEKGVYFTIEEKRQFLEDYKNIDSRLIVNDYDEWQKLGFVATSNWCLDPAKISRGICVNRSSPSKLELHETFKGICEHDKTALDLIEKYIHLLSVSYIKLCDKAKIKREFFGLRDFYSMAKYIYHEVKESGIFEKNTLEKAVRRNFSGLDVIRKPLKYFESVHSALVGQPGEINDLLLIKEAFKESNEKSRYLLLITETENTSITESIKSQLIESESITIIYGSRFPRDQEYNEVRKNILKIKLHMESGSTVILVNCQNLYESLYDVLNKFYSRFGKNNNIVDIGLGNAREKCIVHQNFRLIIVANKNIVYDPKLFPIPLINRLEKHFYVLTMILTKTQKRIMNSIVQWCKKIFKITNTVMDISDYVVGFNENSLASLILSLTANENDKVESSEDIENEIKENLLRCTVSDALISYKTHLCPEQAIVDVYFNKQEHNSIRSFICSNIAKNESFVEITTLSRLPLEADFEFLRENNNHVEIYALKQFDQQRHFTDMLSSFYNQSTNERSHYLFILCENAHLYQDLINCARFCIEDESAKAKRNKASILPNYFVYLLLQIPRMNIKHFAGNQGSRWFCYHIDDLVDEYFISNLPQYDQPLSKFLDNLSPNDLKRIVNRVLVTACLKVKDTNNSAARRYNQLKYLFDHEPEFSFIFLGYIKDLQTESEEEIPSKWVAEASRINNVIEYGSLKRSCSHRLEMRLSTLFASLIALIDANNNLDLASSNINWVKKFWFVLFSNKKLLKIKYKYLIDIEASGVTKENFVCDNISSHNNNTELNLPFSWIIKGHVDNIIQCIRQNSTNNSQEGVRIECIQAEKLFRESDLCKILNENSVIREKFFDLYLINFLLLSKVNNFVNEEHVMLFHSFLKLNISTVFGDLSEPTSVIFIQYVYDIVEFELEIVNYIIQNDENLIPKIANKTTNKANNILFCALNLLLEKMDESFNTFDVLFQQYQKANKIIQPLDEFINKNKRDLSNEYIELYNKIMIRNLFIKSYKSCKQLANPWKIFFDFLVKLNGYTNSDVLNLVICFMDKLDDQITKLKNKDDLKLIIECSFNFIINVLTEFCFVAKDNFDTLTLKQVINELVFNQNRKTIIVFRNGFIYSHSMKIMIIENVFKYDWNMAVSCVVELFNKDRVKYIMNNQELLNFKLILSKIFENELHQRPMVDDILVSDKDKNELFVLALKCFEELNCINVDNQNIINQLETIAKIKFCCNRFVELISIYDETNSIHTIFVQNLHRNTKLFNNKNVLEYVIRQIVKLYGTHGFEFVRRYEVLLNILPVLIQNMEQDNFVILGNDYVKMRNDLKRAFQDDNKKYIPSNVKDEQKVLFEIAAYKLTSSYSFKQPFNVESVLFNQYKVMISESAYGFLEKGKYSIIEDKNLFALILHLFAVILTDDRNDIVKIFKSIVTDIQHARDLFLPAMQHDMFYESYCQLNAVERVAAYVCPKGHRYFIGNCTKPWQKATCECKATIGGVNHKEEAGNKQIQVYDETKKGYCYKPAKKMSKEPATTNATENIRNMNVFETIILKFIIDGLIYISCKTKRFENVKIAMTNDIEFKNTNELTLFFKVQLNENIKILSNYLNQSYNDAYLAIHFYIDKIYRSNIKLKKDVEWLSTKDSRIDFENEFSKLLRNNPIDYKELNKKIIKDMEELNCSLEIVDILNEKDDNLGKTGLWYIDEPKFWSNKSDASLDNMIILLRTKHFDNKNIKLLSTFFMRLNVLKSIEYLKDIIPMLFIICENLNKKYSRKEAREKTLGDLIKDNNNHKFLTQNQLRIIVDGARSFICAWQLSKDNFSAKIQNIINSQEQYLNNDKNIYSLPLSFIFPSASEEGLCICILVDLLVKTQNDNIKLFNITSHQTQETISLKQIRKFSFIDISNDELQKIVLLNTDYVVDSNKNKITGIEYDFENIQSEIIEAVFGDKPIIENKDMPIYTYEGESLKLNHFEYLSTFIKQVDIEFEIIKQLNAFYTTPSTISEMIRLLLMIDDSFSTNGCDRETRIIDFAKTNLKHDISSISFIPEPVYELKMEHLKSFWTVLSLSKAVQLSKYGYDPFDLLHENYKINIENNIEDENYLKNKLCKGNFDLKTSYLMLNELFKYITYYLIKPRQIDVDTFNSNDIDRVVDNITNDNFYEQKLQDLLSIYGNEDFDLTQYDLTDIMGMHVYSTWKLFTEIYSFSLDNERFY